MKKQSSYQKLKAENKKLMGDIYKLVMEPDTMMGLSIKVRYKMKFGVVDACLSGSRSIPMGSGIFTGGLISREKTEAMLPELFKEEINEAIDQKEMSTEEAKLISTKLANQLNSDPEMRNYLIEIANKLIKK